MDFCPKPEIRQQLEPNQLFSLPLDWQSLHLAALSYGFSLADELLYAQFKNHLQREVASASHCFSNIF